MKQNIISGILILFSSFSCSSQSVYFEGTVKYDMKILKLTDNSIEKEIQNFIGTERILIFQEGSYRYLGNSNSIEEDMFLNSDKKSYVKYINNDTIYTANKDYNVFKLLQTEVIKNADTISGMVCDLVIIKTKHEITGTICKTSHYYNSEALKINPDWFKEVEYGNLNLIYSIMKSIPIKSVLEFDFGTFESNAIEIKYGIEHNLEKEILELINNKLFRPQRL